MPTIAEYEVFQRLTDALSQASSAASDMAHHQPDHKLQWEKVGETLRVTKEIVFRIASERAQ